MIVTCGTIGMPHSRWKIFPAAMPSEAPNPSSTVAISVASLARSIPLHLFEASPHQIRQRVHCVLGVLSLRRQSEPTAPLRREHENAHDALAVHLQPVLLHADVGGEAPGDLHEL